MEKTSCLLQGVLTVRRPLSISHPAKLCPFFPALVEMMDHAESNTPVVTPAIRINH